MKIGITGADGLIGWHMRAWLRAHRQSAEVRLATRSTFLNIDQLVNFVNGLDVIVHCAGMNRGDDTEVESTNVDIARSLIQAIEIAVTKGTLYPHVLYANSVHIELDTAYGRGKQAAALLLADVAAKYETCFSNLVLPHVFGEFGKPFYNSVVSTFCHQLVLGEMPQVFNDGELELIHAQEVAARFAQAIESKDNSAIRVLGNPLRVTHLLNRLKQLHDQYMTLNKIPDLQDKLDRELFNTLLSFRCPEYSQTPLSVAANDQAHLLEAIKTGNNGQAVISIIPQNLSDGDYFHTYKPERRLVCTGEVTVKLRKLFSNEVHVFNLNDKNQSIIDIPTFYTHSVTNIGTVDATMLTWVDETFDSSIPDYFVEKVVN